VLRSDYQIRYRRYDFGNGNSLQEIKHFTWCLNFHLFRYFSLFIFSSFCSARACHVLSDKQTSTSLSPTDIRRSQFHHLRCHDRWWCNTFYVYVTIYAAIHCKGRSGRVPRFNPSALLLIAVSSRVRNYATEKISIWTVKSRSGRSFASISI